MSFKLYQAQRATFEPSVGERLPGRGAHRQVDLSSKAANKTDQTLLLYFINRLRDECQSGRRAERSWRERSSPRLRDLKGNFSLINVIAGNVFLRCTHTHTHTHTHTRTDTSPQNLTSCLFTHTSCRLREMLPLILSRVSHLMNIRSSSPPKLKLAVHGSVAQLPVALPFPTRQNFYFTSRVLEDASAQAVKRGSLHFVPFPLSLSSLPSCFLHHHLFFVFFFLFSPFFPSSFRLLFFSPFPSSSPSSSSTYFTSSAPSILLLHPLLIL